MSNKEKTVSEQQNMEIAMVNEQSVRDKIYIVRGTQVMLDFELAEIYGYSTSAFNQQVKRNEGKFPEDFRFQLTAEEYRSLLSQNVTASWGGDRRSEPWAFTESGIYMLMTVLKGDFATKQSIALIRTFRKMKDYIIQNQPLIEQHKYLRMLADTQKEVSIIRRDLDGYEILVKEHDERLAEVMEQLSDTVRKSELSPIMQDFSREEVQREYLFLDDQPLKADAAYIGIYAQAKQTQFPEISITFIKTENKAHDRFIVLDYDTDAERIFHCGASSKDVGKKLAAITEFTEGAVKQSLHDVVAKMLGNPILALN